MLCHPDYSAHESYNDQQRKKGPQTKRERGFPVGKLPSCMPCVRETHRREQEGNPRTEELQGMASTEPGRNPEA